MSSRGERATTEKKSHIALNGSTRSAFSLKLPFSSIDNLGSTIAPALVRARTVQFPLLGAKLVPARLKTMSTLCSNVRSASLLGTSSCPRLPLRPCTASERQCNPRQRKLDISCSAQSVSGSLRQGRSESRKDRLHVIALISEAVSVNVSCLPCLGGSDK